LSTIYTAMISSSTATPAVPQSAQHIYKHASACGCAVACCDLFGRLILVGLVCIMYAID
jgi:hypothetical protein